MQRILPDKKQQTNRIRTERKQRNGIRKKRTYEVMHEGIGMPEKLRTGEEKRNKAKESQIISDIHFNVKIKA